MCYYEDNQEQFADDCMELNQVLGEAMDEFEDRFQGKHNSAITTEVIPVVLTKMLAMHFKHFYYDEPQDIMHYLNYIKNMFINVCDDREELDMIKQVEYGSEVQAWSNTWGMKYSYG